MTKIPVMPMNAITLRSHLEQGARLFSYWKPRSYSVQKSERWFVLVTGDNSCRVQKSAVDALLRAKVITAIPRRGDGYELCLTEILEKTKSWQAVK